MVEGGRTPLLTPTELHEIGFDLVVTPLTALMSATRAVQEAFAILAQEGTMRLIATDWSISTSSGGLSRQRATARWSLSTRRTASTP